MKKLLLILTLSFVTNASFGCSCVEPNFTQDDIDNAVSKFISEKLKIPNENITSIKLEETEGFISNAGKAFFKVILIGNTEDEKRCELSCARSVNTKDIYELKYVDRGLICTQQIHVKMKSNVFSSGFKSKVKTKSAATCIN